MNLIMEIKMKKMVGILALPILLSTGTAATASSVSACKEIHWQPYQVYTVRSALHQRTHIILPEPVQGKPVPGSPQLWDVDAENTHLFIKPKNLGNREGGHTTVTAISTSNTSFDFKITRVKSNPDTCIRIVRDNALVAGQTQGWSTPEQRVNRSLEAEIRMLKLANQKAKKDNGVQIEEALMAYRSNIFTGYQWENGSGFFSKETVSDVWDDGRFTYVRLKEPNKGILTITALVNDKEEMADYKYEPSTKVYMISGLYPKFIMRYDDAEIEVTRSENKD
jgi:type IV secretory pathway VirB9-like protein